MAFSLTMVFLVASDNENRYELKRDIDDGVGVYRSVNEFVSCRFTMTISDVTRGTNPHNHQQNQVVTNSINLDLIEITCSECERGAVAFDTKGQRRHLDDVQRSREERIDVRVIRFTADHNGSLGKRIHLPPAALRARAFVPTAAGRSGRAGRNG